MVNTIKFTGIEEIAERLARHPMLSNLSLELVAAYTMEFLGLFGFLELYLDKTATITLREYRAKLPCGVVRIELVRTPDKIYLKSMSSTFVDRTEHPAFKVLGNYLYSNIKDGDLEIAYKSSPVDDLGLPLILDDEKFKAALTAFIKMKKFEIYFDEAKIDAKVYLNAQTEYSFRAALLARAMTIPSLSEMQSLTNMWNKMHLTTKDFYSGFAVESNIDGYKNH